MSLVYKIAATDEDHAQVEALRHAVLVGERGFIPETISVEQNKHVLHFMAVRDGKTVGVISLFFETKKGLPIEHYFDLTPFKLDRHGVEFSRFAVTPEERRTLVSLGVMTLAYETAKKRGAKQIFIDMFDQDRAGIRSYEKMGFKRIGTGVCFGNKIAVLMLNIYQDSIYELDKSKGAFRQRMIRQLAKLFQGDTSYFQ